MHDVNLVVQSKQQRAFNSIVHILAEEGDTQQLHKTQRKEKKQVPHFGVMRKLVENSGYDLNTSKANGFLG